MPIRSLRPCAAPRCSALSDKTYCNKHRREQEKKRGTSSQRGYGSKWKKARQWFLMQHLFCVACQAEGRLTPANTVDHIKDHKGDYTLFWDASNWQALCHSCHSRKTFRDHR